MGERVVWYRTDARRHKGRKWHLLPSDGARVAWDVLWAEAKLHTLAGTFENESHLRACMGVYARYVSVLRDAGLLDGLHVHDWEKWQDSATGVSPTPGAERKRRQRERDGERDKGRVVRVTKRDMSQGQTVTKGVTKRDMSQGQSVTPRPRVGQTTDVPKGTSRIEHPGASKLCERLSERLTANGVKHSVTADWRDAARLLLDKDRRPLPEALALVDWATADEFWRGNVLSMPTFRHQYDRLRLAPKAKANGHAPAQPTVAEMNAHREAVLAAERS